MALSRTNVTSAVAPITGATPYGTASFSTSSFTPASSSLLVAIVGAASETDISGSDITISGGGWTWTKRGDVQTNSSGYYSKLQIFTAPVSTGASMTVTVDHAASVHTWHVHVLTYTGYDTSTPIGATGTDTALEDAGQFNLSGSPASTSEVVAARFLVPNEGIAEAATPGSGWTETFDTADPNSNGWGGMESQIRGSSTSSSVDWVDTTVSTTAFTNIGAAIEIKAAASGASDGSASGVGAVSGVGQSNALSNGSASGTGTATGVGASQALSAGSASGTGTATGVGQPLGIGAGSASGVGAATGVGLSNALSAGSSAGVGTATGVGASNALSTGSAAGVGTATGVSAGIPAGSAAGVGTATGVGLSNALATGASSGTGSATGIGASNVLAAGSSSGTGAATGIASTVSIGSAAGVGTANGLGLSLVTSAGSASGFGVLTGSGLASVIATGSASGSGLAAAISGEAVTVGGKWRWKEGYEKLLKHRENRVVDLRIQKAAGVISSLGGHARAQSLTAKQRSNIASNAAKARWR